MEAWIYLDPEYALAQAKAADEWRLSGRPTGGLHGVPVGLKDIIDTGDMPTENGSVLHAGRTPSRDAAVVERLRAAGAVIMGKTVTTEFATRTAGKTRNPHNPAHTPGGSSSGSAAAVAAGMVPLSLGSQTGGSTIRPGSYCGVYALKPTHGLVSRHGMFQLSRSLDHVGLFGRTIEDLALLLEEIAGYDERDPDTHPRGRGPYRAVAMEEPPIEPRFGFFRSGRWDRIAEDAQAALGEVVEHLGGRVEEFELSAGADELAEWHRVIMDSEVAVNLRREWETGRDRLSAPLRARIEAGHAVRAPEYLAARAAAAPLLATFTELFEQRYDAILTPARGRDGAGRARVHRRADLLHAVDDARPALGEPAAAPGRQRPAAGRAARGSAPRRRAAPAHRALARGVRGGVGPTPHPALSPEGRGGLRGPGGILPGT